MTPTTKWHNLISLLERENRFDYPLFKEAYLETFAILQPAKEYESDYA